jgi:glycine betaine/proline transport system substrate-binding protein
MNAGLGMFRKQLGAAALALALAASATGGATAGELPGEGVSVQPVLQQGLTEELFQTYLVGTGLEELGYEVEEPILAQMQAAFVAVANGDATYYAAFWWPLHKAFQDELGGDATLPRVGTLVRNSIQGYLIDKKTADARGIKTIDQFEDPEIAKLFDIDDDGKADLYGCEPGWGCERIIEHHLDAYGLRDTGTHRQGGYVAIIPDAIERIRSGKPTLYYTWTPLWLSGVLHPGQEVVWLNVPFTALPEEQAGAETTVPGLGNLGFSVNTQHVVANPEFLEENPAARRWFELLEIPIEDINAQNLKVHEGENSERDIRRHAEEWVKAHQDQWNAWIAEARQAGS